ncbi:hypothetical protein MRX96_047536 [Rhipicephalus microplus]
MEGTARQKIHKQRWVFHPHLANKRSQHTKTWFRRGQHEFESGEQPENKEEGTRRNNCPTYVTRKPSKQWTATVATLVEVVKKLERRLSEPKSGHEDNSSSQKSPQESVRRSGRNGRKNQQCDQQCDATTDGSVTIGEGVTLTKEELEKLWQTPNLNATKKGGNRNKEILDPVRLKTIIDYTLSQFDANKCDLRKAISSLLFHQRSGTTP